MKIIFAKKGSGQPKILLRRKICAQTQIDPNISVHIFHRVLYIFTKSADRENLFNNQELLKFVIISLTL